MGAPPPRAWAPPPDQLYHRGTPNAWSMLSVDEEKGLIFVPFGSPGLDFIGAHRFAPGFDLGYYANSVVALRASTGRVVWRFQAVHHDLWDYDLAAQPLLLDIETDKGPLPALIQATKMGFLFVLNRYNGRPIYPVREMPVPQTLVPGEVTAKTQPFPTFPEPLHPLGLTADDAWGFTPLDRNACREKILDASNEGMYTPPALGKYTIQFPGVAGGQNWGGVAHDPVNNLLVMPQNYVVTYNKLLPRESMPELPAGDDRGGYSPNLGTPFVIKHEILLSPLGAPCIAPPWGTLLAVSLDSGKKVWEVPLGTPQDMVPGLSWFPWFPAMGFPSAGGALVTGSGLVFIGAALDNYLRAFDVHSGGELWRARLPAGAQATPMTYRGDNGRQYVVIAAGGHAYMRTTPGDSLVAFALRD
ncbi:MAG: PQQ-binding-like beta-propeller repeat protein [Halioglobus sp.]|nr:PQQ-binding-like beta-propeller repeat protein [Halioglobus sp.]